MSHLLGTPGLKTLLNAPAALQWGLLLALSALLIFLFELCGLPAAMLLGAILAAIGLAVGGGNIRVPRLPFHFAQAIVGCMIAKSITADILGDMAQHWLLFPGIVLAVIAVSTWVGWILASRQILPGNTAVWGCSPGAATAMTLMAEAHGEDVRMVAFMQYLRVVFVAVAATLVSRWWVISPDVDAHTSVTWFAPVAWVDFAATLALVCGGVILTRRVSIPAGPLLVPFVAGACLHCGGRLTITLPPWLLLTSYLLIGWSIGLRFTLAILRHVARALPSMAFSALILIALCGGIAFVLTRTLGVDPLTAYLATSPGGVDSVAIIATSAKADMPFVMAMQTARFLVVLMVGPSLARMVGSKVTAKP
ncbi:AbrB family transcriptional regulator [Uliginosibacterium gangwonense]|uniref:AbrB family transcriptional regulator n=1 Tax=Uliginosibacterium gangwonense TaxID=392736 RepID=UPI00036D803F|nr:AbrB family transcriptional regulator [Uliginosibacterium gangwonense]